MITSVRLVNFKNFADETLKVGPFTIIVGANASGKSNIRDAFRFLHGIGRGYTLAEILGGKYGPGGQMEWAGIQGAPNEVGRVNVEFNIPHATFSIDVETDEAGGEKKFYSIAVRFDAFGPDGYSLFGETLTTESGEIYNTHIPNGESDEDRLLVRLLMTRLSFEISRSQPALSQFFGHYKAIYEEYLSLVPDPGFLQILQKMRFLELSPERRIRAIRQKCPEDFDSLAQRLGTAVQAI